MPTALTLPDIERGDTIPFTFNFDDGAAALDMRGKTLIFSMKLGAAMDDSSAALTKSVLRPINAPDEQKGTISFQLEKSETAKLIPFADYDFSVRIMTPGSPEDIETTYFNGTVPVKDS